MSKTVPKVLLSASVMVFIAAAGSAQADPAAPAPAASGVTLELNKFEPYDKGCRTYMVVNNATDSLYQSFKLDLVLFQPDGVISKRIALDLAPVRPNKRTVKPFELDGVACDKIGSILINDMMECKTDAGPQADCLTRISTSSLTNVQISK